MTTKAKSKVSWQDWLLSRVICGLFVFGCYSLAHFVFQAPDHMIMIFALAMIWSRLSDYAAEPDALNPEEQR